MPNINTPNPHSNQGATPTHPTGVGGNAPNPSDEDELGQLQVMSPTMHVQWDAPTEAPSAAIFHRLRNERLVIIHPHADLNTSITGNVQRFPSSPDFTTIPHHSVNAAHFLWGSYFPYYPPQTHTQPIILMPRGGGDLHEFLIFPDALQSTEPAIERDQTQRSRTVLLHPSNPVTTIQDDQLEQSTPTITRWVQPLLITASIIAAIGIAIIFWGSSTNSPTVVFAGLITFSAAISIWALPFAVITYWMIREIATFASKTLLKR